MPRTLTEVPLTLFRYEMGGWRDFLGNLVLYLTPGQVVTIRMKEFSKAQEEQAVTSLKEILGLTGETELSSKWTGTRWFSFVDYYIDLQDPRDRSDLLVVLQAKAEVRKEPSDGQRPRSG